MSLVSTMLLLNRCFGLMVCRVHQSVFGAAPAVTARLKRAIRLIGNKQSTYVSARVVRTIQTVTSKGYRQIY